MPPCGALPRALVLISLILAASAQNGVVVQTALWCVAKNDAEDAALLGALNWACGPGGADCRPIQQGGPCYDANDVQLTASYAFNDYYQKHGMTDDACYFNNNAALTSLNPSYGSCKFPSSKAGSNGSMVSTSNTLGTTGSYSGGGLSHSDRRSGHWLWPLLISHLFTIAWTIAR